MSADAHLRPLSITSHRHATGALFEHRTVAQAVRERIGDRSQHRLIAARPDETIAEAIGRQTARLTLSGALIGAASFGLLVALVALAWGVEIGTAGGVGAAVALTGGPFFGALAGFCVATVRGEHLTPLVERLPAERGAALLVISGPRAEVDRALGAALAR